MVTTPIYSYRYLDVPQTALETVIPKMEPRYILFVQGVHQGEVGFVSIKSIQISIRFVFPFFIKL